MKAGEDLLGVPRRAAPPFHIRDARPDQVEALMAEPGEAVDPATGRRFFLDYPADLGPDEPVTLILALHGAGSIGNWHRHYFPAMDLVARHRLVVATPTAAGAAGIMLGAPPVRMWLPQDDDAHLMNVAELVAQALGRRRIARFWLAGHSQGGATANRLLAQPFWKDRVDGWLSLSGGRLGPVRIPEGFGPPRPPGEPPPQLPGGVKPGAAAMIDADVDFIFATGAAEIVELPPTSPWAERYGGGARRRRPDVVDERPGYVWDNRRPDPSPAWGGPAAPGTAEVWVYPGLKDGRLVADVVRLGKGHTEGLEPHVTETIVRLMAGLDR